MLVGSRDTGEYPRHVSYEEAILAGTPNGGGLYVPTEFPRFVDGELEALNGQTYEHVSAHVQHMWAPEVPRTLFTRVANAAYDRSVFTKKQHGQITPVNLVDHNIFMMELGLSPTYAFKDIALQMLGRMMEASLSERGKQLTIVGATSGDTGSAAIEAVRGSAHMNCVILSPTEGPTPIQAGQMARRSDWKQIHNLQINGTFDDCQDIVKVLLDDPEIADQLGAMNSINWGRIIAQIPYSVNGYTQTLRKAGLPLGSPIDAVVPTGNFGDALSVFYARQMGVPIRNIYIATNENDVMHQLVSSGVYAAHEIQKTSSPSMDISKVSNFERLAYYIFKGSARQTKAYMDIFTAEGRVEFKDFGVDNLVLRSLGFRSGSSDHESRIAMIRRVYSKTRRVIDPHTADAMSVAVNYASRDIPTLVYSTADQVKFPEVISEALGTALVPPRDPDLIGVERYNQIGFKRIENSATAVKTYLQEHVLVVPV